jgi:cytochrome c55X
MPERLVGVLTASLLASGAAAADPLPARQAELLDLLLQDCGSCHGLTLKGGLGPALLPKTLAGKDADGLAQLVLQGVPGTPMPPWAPELTAGEARWLVARLQEGVQ